MREKEFKEGLGDLAHAAERDHEVQMARAELYKIAKYAIKLHEILKGVSEAEGLEGWVQSKITKSADMIGSVYHHLDYQESPMGEVTEAAEEKKTCGKCGQNTIVNTKKGWHCSNCDTKKTNETSGQYKNDAQRKAIHASKAKKGYKESLQAKLSAKLGK